MVEITNVNRRFMVLFVVCLRQGLMDLKLASNPLCSPQDWPWISDPLGYRHMPSLWHNKYYAFPFLFVVELPGERL